jgi:formate hydrogenlyase subunit 4
MEVLYMMKILGFLISPLAALVLSPLMAGIINRTKAVMAGRKGPRLLQPYDDLFRLFRKGSVFSTTTSWIFRIAPVVIFSTTLAVSCLVPFLPLGKGFSFVGDVVVLLYLLGFARFFLIISALDTGSAFEGMGASREAFFSAIAEPVIFLCFLSIMRANGTSSIMEALSAPVVSDSVAAALTAIPLFVILLAENARIPFDDPTTHLELTMIHEVMILDNSGSGLALLEYAASIKLWIFSLILARILLPLSGLLAQTVLLLGLMVLIAICIGLVESYMARTRLIKVPHLFVGAGIVALLGFLITITDILSSVRPL